MKIPLHLIASVIRWGLNFAGAALVTKGLIEPEQVMELSGAVLSLVSIGWSAYTHSQNDLVNKKFIVTPNDPKVPPY